MTRARTVVRTKAVGFSRMVGFRSFRGFALFAGVLAVTVRSGHEGFDKCQKGDNGKEAEEELALGWDLDIYRIKDIK